MFLKQKTNKYTEACYNEIKKLRYILDNADTVIIGAGAGLSTSAGFTYSGERFHKYFSDFEEKYDFHDMYSGGFYPYETLEEYWAYWSRYIYINRYMDVGNGTYQKLRKLVEGKTVQILSTNVDHCFQRAGFDKERLFYTQGDYGLFQCSTPCHQNTYDNEENVRKMMEAQGYVLARDSAPHVPEGVKLKMKIPTVLIPFCPVCHKPMAMNLRADNTFVEDEGWHRAAGRYEDFLEQHQKERVLFLELGVGYNTPGIIKYPFWQMTYKWQNAYYVCLNYSEAYAPKDIKDKSLCIDGDIKIVLHKLLEV